MCAKVTKDKDIDDFRSKTDGNEQKLLEKSSTF